MLIEEIAPEPRGLELAGGVDLDHIQRIAGIEVPDLVRPDAVQVGALARLEQEIDRRRYAAFAAKTPGQGGAGDTFRGTIGLAEIATFGMGRELQSIDELADVDWDVHEVTCR